MVLYQNKTKKSETSSGIRSAMTIGNEEINNAIIFLFFLFTTFINLIDLSVVRVSWYLVCIACTIMSFVINKSKISVNLIIPCLVVLVTGVLNILFVANNDILKLAFTIISFFISELLMTSRFNKKVILNAIYVNIAIIVLSFLIRGITTQVYASASNNFISVILLYPAVIYYSLVERDDNKCSIIPAVIIWGLSIIGTGRGGIISCSILLLGVLLYVNNKQNISKKLLFIMVSIIVAVILIVLFSNKIDQLNIFNRFVEYGIRDTGRTPAWEQYYNITKESMKSILFGTNKNAVPWIVRYNGNIHNSFINIHIYNGLIMLVCAMAWIINTILYSVRNKKWLFLVCLVSFCFRSLTDNVFWGTAGTPIFISLVLYPLFNKKYESRVFNEK